MPIISGEITADGAIVVVLVGVSKNRQALLEKLGLPVPAPIPVNAQVDTGSFATGFLPEVFQSLGVGPFAVIPVRTTSTKPDEPWHCEQYDVSVTFVSGMNHICISSVHAIAGHDFSKGEEGVQAILGRDVLNHCVLNWCGNDQTFNLALP